jgi:hypothetical protein
MHLLAPWAVREPLLLDARLVVRAAADLVLEPWTEFEAIYKTMSATRSFLVRMRCSARSVFTGPREAPQEAQGEVVSPW